MSDHAAALPVDDFVFPLADEADLCALNLERIAATLLDFDPVCAANLRRAADRLRTSLAADGHSVTPADI